MFFYKTYITLFLVALFFLGSVSTTLAQTTSDTTYHSPKILLIGIDPTDASGASLANTYFKGAMNNLPSIEFELQHAQKTVNDFKELSGGKIQYSIAKHLHLTTFPTYPNGYVFTVANYINCVWGRPEFNPTQCDIQKSQFPYAAYFEQHQVCQVAAEVGADEIWVYSPPYILAHEAFMIGPTTGFWVNGPGYVLPSCAKHIVVVNPVYDTPDNMLHSYGHRVEATIDYLMRNFTEDDRTLYWERFAARHPPTRDSNQTFCGNVHFPFNYRFEYDMGNSVAEANTCADFENFPNYTNQTATNSCTDWGCNDRGWQKYWMSNIPNSVGSVSVTTRAGKTIQFSKDWWFYILYPENAMKLETLTVPVSSPQSSPTPTPNSVGQCVGDINGDKSVNLIDYSLLVGAFMKIPIQVPAADLNGDDQVNLFDYSLLVSNFMKHCLVMETPPNGLNYPDTNQAS